MTESNLALVGAGYWGKNLARNFLGLGALHTLCDANPNTLASYGAEYDAVARAGSLESVLSNDQIQRVAIGAPAALHYRLAKQSLLADKDVYVEKPLCLDLQEAQELIDIAEQRQRILMVGHLLQYHPYVQKLGQMVASGELGRLYYITSNRLNLGKIRQEENSLWSFAPHDISVILSLAGELPQAVCCHGENYLTDGVADTTLTQLKFTGGLRAHVYVSWLNPFKEQKLTVVGSEGMAVFDDTRPWEEKLVVYRNYLTWAEGSVPTANKREGEPILVEQSEPLRNECQHFLECCQHRQAPRTDGNEGLRVLKVLQAAQRSLDADGSSIETQPKSCPSEPATSNCRVHPTAVVDAQAQIGEGTSVWHFSHISDDAKIGQGCNIGQNVFVAPGVEIGDNVKIQNNVAVYTGTVIEDDVFLGPSCVLTNVTNPRSQVVRRGLYEKTHFKRGVTVGANATIVCGITLGRYAFIAAGAVVTKDVPDYAMIAGVPGRQQGWMSRHGHRLDFEGATKQAVCPESQLRYELSPDGTRVHCLDLDEEAPLPEDLSVGSLSYDELKVSTKD